MGDRLTTICIRASSIIALLLLWWAASIMLGDPEVLPTPAAIAKTLVADLQGRGPEGESPFFDIGITLAIIFVAFAAAMLAGIGIGLAMGLNRVLENSLNALIPLLLTIPTILMVFLAIMWFGFSELGGLVAVVVVVTPFVSVNIFEGTRAMDTSLIEMGRSFQAGHRLLLRKVYLPQRLCSGPM